MVIKITLVTFITKKEMKKLKILLVVLILFVGCTKEYQEPVNLIGCWNVMNDTNEKYYFSFGKSVVNYYTSISSGICTYELSGDNLSIQGWCDFKINHVNNPERIHLSNDSISMNLCRNYINYLE